MNVFAELIRRGYAYPGEQQQRNSDAEIRRVQEMPCVVFHGNAKNGLGSDCGRTGKHNRQEPGTTIKKHGTGHTGDVSGEEKLKQIAPASSEPGCTALEMAVHQFKPDLACIGRQNAHHGDDPCLLKSEDSVAQNIEYRNGDGKTAQASQSVCNSG